MFMHIRNLSWEQEDLMVLAKTNLPWLLLNAEKALINLAAALWSSFPGQLTLSKATVEEVNGMV